MYGFIFGMEYTVSCDKSFQTELLAVAVPRIIVTLVLIARRGTSALCVATRQAVTTALFVKSGRVETTDTLCQQGLHSSHRRIRFASRIARKT